MSIKKSRVINSHFKKEHMKETYFLIVIYYGYKEEIKVLNFLSIAVPDKCILFLLMNVMNAKAKKDQIIDIIGVILEFD